MKSKKHTCPICKSLNTKFSLKAKESHGPRESKTKKQFSYYQCMKCKCLFLVDVKFDSRFYKKYYNITYRKPTMSHAQSFGKKIISFANVQKRILIQKYLPDIQNKIHLLDIGVGNGDFLNSLRKSNYKLFGTEIDPHVSSTDIYTVYNIDMAANLKKKLLKFHVVTLWHVLEHITRPHILFQNIHKILVKNGLLLVSLPSIESIGFKEGKENWFHLDAPRHIIFYSTETIQYLSQKYGFGLKEVKNNWYEFPTDLYYSLKHSPRKYFYYMFYPFFKYIDRETVTYVLIKK